MVGTLENVLSFPFHSASSPEETGMHRALFMIPTLIIKCVCVGVRIANKHILKQDLSPFPELACSQMNSIVKFSHAEFGFFSRMKADDLTSPPHGVRGVLNPPNIWWWCEH